LNSLLLSEGVLVCQLAALALGKDFSSRDREKKIDRQYVEVMRDGRVLMMFPQDPGARGELLAEDP
jgi:hypothetical protein